MGGALHLRACVPGCNRYYLDEDISYRVTDIVRRRSSIDLRSTREEGRNGTPDEEQLRFATEQGRCLITRNYRDFDGISRRLLAEGGTHAGVLFVPSSLSNDDFHRLALAIIAYARLHPEGALPNMTDWLRPTAP